MGKLFWEGLVSVLWILYPELTRETGVAGGADEEDAAGEANVAGEEGIAGEADAAVEDGVAGESEESGDVYLRDQVLLP